MVGSAPGAGNRPCKNDSAISRRGPRCGNPTTERLDILRAGRHPVGAGHRIEGGQALYSAPVTGGAQPPVSTQQLSAKRIGYGG
ncbi:hypothetical protein [Microbulbifer halophilus]|uniref:hypothetical protein n=1 Tax=Microbulbifer halophilus TaxID=453963 RepID=UPI00361CDE40